MKRVVHTLVGLSLLVICTGCVVAAVGAGAGAGAGAYAYINGELQAAYGTPIEQIWPKTLEALHDLRLTVDRKQVDALGGVIEGRRADGTPFTLQLKPVGERSTSIGVRIGTFGSKSKSELIHRAIQNRVEGS